MNDQVSLLFREVADLPRAERENVFVARKVPLEIRAEVESLLAFDAGADRSVTACIGQAAEAVLQTGDEREGGYCGPYRLIRVLGLGGMGAVYLAERDDGEIQQRVAIKMLRVDAVRPAWQERFLRERQILAGLNHPSIARVFDAGRNDQGRPYLVMEYVDGVPIDVASQGKNLREQLALFLKVCEGVAYAHRHLIIHRDLKPSNILVDASGQPKLLDFGIAKLLVEASDEISDQTKTVERMLTPGYASPEQLRGAIQTTATDIYSLGAVLYKMLVGRSPHQSDAGEMQAIEIVAGMRKIQDPRRINPALPSDVSHVLQKALRTEPDERYVSVEALAGDIRAFLESRPLEVRSSDAWYRTRKFFRRHWVPLSAAALVVASLSIGLYVANRERALAQRRFQDVRQLSNKLFEVDRVVSQLPGSTKARQLIVDTSLEYLRRLTSNAQGDAELILEVGNAYRYVAEVEGVTVGPNLGQVENAQRDLTIADGLIQSVIRTQPQNRTAFLRAAEIAADRMAVVWQGGRYDGSLAFARKSADWLEKFDAAKADQSQAREILTTYSNVAHQYMITEYYDEALRLSSRGVDLAVLFGRPLARAGFLDTRALSLRYRGDLEGALTAIRESVSLNETAPAGFARDLNLTMALSREGWILGEDDGISLGRAGEALTVLDRAFKIADDLVHKDSNDESARSRLFLAAGALADILRHSDPRRALEVYDHTYRDMAEISSNPLRIREVDLLAGSSYALQSLGRPAEARQRLDQALALLNQLKLYPSDKIEAGSEADRTLCALADHEADTGNVPRAIELYDGLLDRLNSGGAKPETSLQDAVDLSHIWATMAALHRRAGQAHFASTFESRRLELWRQWERKLPENPFVLRQIAEKAGE